MSHEGKRAEVVFTLTFKAIVEDFTPPASGGERSSELRRELAKAMARAQGRRPFSAETMVHGAHGTIARALRMMGAVRVLPIDHDPEIDGVGIFYER